MQLGLVGLVISLFAAAASPVRADVQPPSTGGGDIYDSIDSVTARAQSVFISGVLHGASTSTSKLYFSFDPTTAERCDRLALLMMAKPGKYQFAVIGADFGEHACQLLLRTP